MQGIQGKDEPICTPLAYKAKVIQSLHLPLPVAVRERESEREGGREGEREGGREGRGGGEREREREREDYLKSLRSF
jgi:hypothetical protein